MIITIDGTYGSGKSTVAKELAKKLEFKYINTGAMYNQLSEKVIENNLSTKDKEKIIELAKTIIDDKKRDYSIDVRNLSIIIAQIPEVREIFNDLQRKMSLSDNIVIEGRDTGTVVFPDADFKFYLTALIEVRAKRMFGIMLKNGTEEEKKKYKSYKDLIPVIEDCDRKDMERKIAPLKMADNAILFDNSDSPSGKEGEEHDANILKYYIHHLDEIKKNIERN